MNLDLQPEYKPQKGYTIAFVSNSQFLGHMSGCKFERPISRKRGMWGVYRLFYILASIYIHVKVQLRRS
ncbi:hypothetical protein Hdeb2414_s0054g00755291 [Helianthus debilis subsp. tardiflorus]